MINSKAELLKYYKRSYDDNLMKGTIGNVSIYDEKSGHVFITLSGVDHIGMNEDDLVEHDFDGNILGGNHKPSP